MEGGSRGGLSNKGYFIIQLTCFCVVLGIVYLINLFSGVNISVFSQLTIIIAILTFAIVHNTLVTFMSDEEDEEDGDQEENTVYTENGMIRIPGYQLSIDLDYGMKYPIMFVKGSSNDMENLFDQINIAIGSENMQLKRNTDEINFRLQGDFAKLFLSGPAGVHIEKEADKIYISHKLTLFRILAWSPIYAYLLFLSIRFTVEGIYSIIFLNDYWLLNFPTIAGLWVVPFIPVIIFSMIGFALYRGTGGLPVRMSRVVIDLSDKSLTWEHKNWPRFFTKKEEFKHPANLSLDFGYHEAFEGGDGDGGH